MVLHQGVLQLLHSSNNLFWFYDNLASPCEPQNWSWRPSWALDRRKNDLPTIFVCHFLHVWSSVLCGCRVLLVAFIILFNVCFQMSLHINAREDSKSHWLHLFDFSPLYLFKCVLNVLGLEETYTCIGCISLAFPHCAFSSASLSFLFYTVPKVSSFN